MRFCPNCESEDVEPEMGAQTLFAEGDINSWKCNKCGHVGLMPEKDEQSDEERDISHPDFYEKLIIITAMVVVGLLIYFFL
jgi:uncharacterized OB-fold protein